MGQTLLEPSSSFIVLWARHKLATIAKSELVSGCRSPTVREGYQRIRALSDGRASDNHMNPNREAIAVSAARLS